MMGKFLILISFFSLLFFPVFSQTDDQPKELLQVPLFFTESNPESPLGIFSLDFPFFFGQGNPSGHQLSFGYTMGNVWHPQAWFYYPQEMTPAQANATDQLPMTLRPTYFRDREVKTAVKSYQADGVLQHFRFTWLNRWKEKNSLIVNMNLHMLRGGKSPLNFFVSDRFIEDWHSSVAVEDNFGRRLYPFNRALIEFEDENGKVFRKDKGDIFPGVADVHYYRGLYEADGAGWRLSTQAGFHVSLPLNDFHSYIIPGINAGIRSDFLLGPRSSLTLAFDGGMTFQNFLKTGEGMKAIDRKRRIVSNFYAGFNSQSKRGIFVFGILNQYQDPLLKGGRMDWNQTGFDKLGIRFLQAGDVWEGQPLTQQFWLAKLTPAALYNFAVRTYFILGFNRDRRFFNIFVAEDMITINNAPDFQIGFQYRFLLPSRK